MFTDALIMDKTWDAPGGFLGFSARFARTGVQMYDGSEIDPAGEYKLADGTPRFQRGTLYPVDRPASEVFKPSSLASFIAKPLTNDHPSEGVTIDNWADKTKGVIGEVLRDGQFARMSGLMTDKALIADYRAGKKELSGGYEAKLIIRDGVNDAGETFVAQQIDIVGNHTAFVRRGRAGSLCRVVDAAPCNAAPHSIFDSLTTDGVADAKKWLKKAIALHKMHMNGSAPTTGAEGEKSQMLMMKQMENALAELDGSTSSKTMKMDQLNTQEKPVKTMLIDGLTVDVSNADTAIATITTILAARDAATTDKAAAETQVATLTTQLADATAKVATLEQAVKDAALSPQQLRDAAKAYAQTVDTAKKLAPTAAITDAMDEPAIKRAVVNARLGDAAKDWNDSQVDTSFATLSAQVGDAGNKVHDLGLPIHADAAAKEQQAFKDANDFNAWRTKSAA